MRFLTHAIPVLCTLSSSMLAGAQQGASDALRRDSSCVQIIETPRPAWRTAKAWRVAASPQVVIGSPNARARVAGLVALADDGALMWAGDSAITVFDSRSRVSRLLPADGGRAMRRHGTDSLLIVGDSGIRVMHSTGAPTHTIRWPSRIGSHERSSMPFLGLFGDGSAVLSSPITSGGGHGLRRDSVTLYRVRIDGTSETLARVPAIDWNGDSAVPFAPLFAAVTYGDRYYYGLGDRFELAELASDGTPTRIMRRAWVARPPSDSEVAAARNAVRNLVLRSERRPRIDSVALSRRADEAAAQLVVAPALPAFRSVIIDPDGNLWLRHFSVAADLAAKFGPMPSSGDLAPARFTIFDHTGIWLGDVTMPAWFRPYDIGSKSIVGTWQGPDGSIEARSYALIKP